MNKNRYPEGWDEEHVRRVLEHYTGQSDAEAVAEDGAAFEIPDHITMEVPIHLLPAVRELLAKNEGRGKHA